MKVLEHRGFGGFSIVHITEHFVVVAMRRGLYRVVPNKHRDEPAQFSAMLHGVERSSSTPPFSSVAHARHVATEAERALRARRRRKA